MYRCLLYTSTLVDNRTNLAKSTVEALRENFGNQIKLYRTSIPIAVKAAETSSKGKSIFAYEPNSTAVSYTHLDRRDFRTCVPGNTAVQELTDPA